MKTKGFHKIYWMDLMDPITYSDLVINYDENTYMIGLATKEGRMERASNEITHFLSLLFNDVEAGVHKIISDSIAEARAGKKVEINKTISGRQVVIETTGYDFLNMGISAYPDKK
jgi:hypothetical protein